ncbi:MAG: phosphoglycerate mutase (2,3-diphosphoglycerate-independent) [Candidatus Colwellbacteria bacterium RIFCSPHIGHO2_12_FULL_44_17]|uniref:2,3-bisphosphoglycerate-independent phosphoglycerate mutase n=1 Tax=Candidatus Colwellbacteria bacterium RIFCSPHIGHO2_12_FULL_44_17 TaxID=1797689 RepID=A0A1G1Z2W5_9BACT|nr:MAG: phosphoglycerate mutase (2,3-diphosphoglycerate-independent) [Candidatus Colwellbacteria bacterium RIFCSPHIGHO2_12_FULL_44_17]
MKRTFVLVVLDGWGIGRKDDSNPIHVFNPPTLSYIQHHFPAGTLQASGVAVGLPWQEEGNSEVGHLTIGAGRVIYQHYPRINADITSGQFFKNPTLLQAINHARSNNSILHLVGILTKGTVHSAFEHLLALVKLAEREKIAYQLHLFTDGKDGPLKAALELLHQLPLKRVRTLCGRYYGMERDNHWDRTEKAYQILTNNTSVVADPIRLIESTYERGLSDEFVEPTVVSEGRGIGDNDAVVFFNFREDSMRQMVSTFVEKDFNKFPARQFKNLFVATFTPYGRQFAGVPVAFLPDSVPQCLGEVLAKNGRSQLRVAETEKYAHVTYFFNGLQEEPFKNEYRILIPSRNTPKHDDFPEMMAAEITTRVVASIDEGVFDFILVNYANADMVAHTGNYEAGLKAIAAIDRSIGELLKSVLARNAIMLITADHGNIERMLDPITALPETKHDSNPVPIYLVGKDLERTKDDYDVDLIEQENTGILSDVAPTFLQLMDIPQPPEMTGRSLFQYLR